MGNLIEFSRDPEAMEAVLEPDSRQQVLALVATDEEEPDQDDDSDEGDPTFQQNSPPITSPAAAPATSPAAAGTAKQAKKQSPIAKEKRTSVTEPESELESSHSLLAASHSEDFIQKTDAQLRREFLSQVKEKAASETDERLARMLAKAKFDNDHDIVKIVNTEIDKRFEATREKQMTCSIEIPYSDLLRRGYSASQESVSRFLHRQRLTHKAGVALAKLHLAMKEGGEKMESGKRVLTKAHVVQRIFEKAYDAMKEQEND